MPPTASIIVWHVADFHDQLHVSWFLTTACCMLVHLFSLYYLILCYAFSDIALVYCQESVSLQCISSYDVMALYQHTCNCYYVCYNLNSRVNNL